MSLDCHKNSNEMNNQSKVESEEDSLIDFSSAASTSVNSEKKNSNLETSEETKPKCSTEKHFEYSVDEKKSDNNLTDEKSEEEVKETSDEIKGLKRVFKKSYDLHQTVRKLDCKEKIVLCIDHSDPMSDLVDLEGSKDAVFNAVTSAVKHFLLSKYFISSSHEYSLILVNEDVQLMTEMNSQSNEIIQMLRDVWNSKTIDLPEKEINSAKNDDFFDISLLFKQLETFVKFPSNNFDSTESVPFVVRVIFVYGRSNCPVQLKNSQIFQNLISNPHFFFDALYIHETSSEDNKVEEVYKSLCDLDIEEKSYILETDLSSGLIGIFNCFTKLLGHPLQRQPPNFHVDYELKADEAL